jgi:hypothetical protein
MSPPPGDPMRLVRGPGPSPGPQPFQGEAGDCPQDSALSTTVYCGRPFSLMSAMKARISSTAPSMSSRCTQPTAEWM